MAVPLEAMQEITRRLIAGVAQPLFPIVLPWGDDSRLARLSGGLLARIVAMAESALTLSQLDRFGDLGILTRCEFEHVVMLAWLNGSSSGHERYERMLLWQRADDESRLRIDREVSVLNEAPLLRQEDRVRLQADIELMKDHRIPNLADRALVADREWSGRLGTDDGLTSLRAFYSVVFRTTSAAVHPTQTGLGLVTSKTPSHAVIHLEKTGTAASALGVVPALLMTALLVSAYTTGRPSLKDAETALDRLLSDIAEAGVRPEPSAQESRPPAPGL